MCRCFTELLLKVTKFILHVGDGTFFNRVLVGAAEKKLKIYYLLQGDVEDLL